MFIDLAPRFIKDEPSVGTTPTSETLGKEATDWLTDVLDIYGGKLQGSIQGQSGTVAWGSSIGLAIVPIVYGVMVGNLGEKMAAEADSQKFCSIYRNVRRNKVYTDLSALNMVKSAPKEKQEKVVKWIEPGKGKSYDDEQGLGLDIKGSYVAISYQASGMLVYMVWKDYPCTSDQIVSSKSEGNWVTLCEVGSSDGTGGSVTYGQGREESWMRTGTR